MHNFLTLCKYELRKQFPKGGKDSKTDVVGIVLSLVITLFVAAIFILLLSTIATNYVAIKINKVQDPIGRASELLNVFYLGTVLAMTFMSAEKIRKTLSQEEDKRIFLRLPIKPETMFLSKLTVLVLENFIVSLFIILPINIITFFAIGGDLAFWLRTALVCVFLPLVAFLFATIIAVPYIKAAEFIQTRYVLLFIVASIALIAAFLVYSQLLSTVQSLLETGSIKFLFNEDFINTLQFLLVYAYPANMFAHLALGVNLTDNLIAISIIVLVALPAVYFIARSLFYTTLYKNDDRSKGGKPIKTYKKTSPISALIRKEFISVFREPKHMFSYFAIATAMPVMAYCCYTLFESLIFHSIGVTVNFALAMLVVLVFSILTNTFCATNISRDGLSALNSKMFPVKPTKILLSKVIFCMLVSTLAVVVSCVILALATSLSYTDAIIVAVLSTLFSSAQIFVATRMDLDYAKVASGPRESERIVNITIAKIVLMGLAIALVMGILSMLVTILTLSGNEFYFPENFEYAIPVVFCTVYFAVALFYYVGGIRKSFDNLVA